MTSSKRRIPMLDLPAQHAAIEAELFEGFSELLASGRFILGDAVESFESDLAKLCDLPHALGCNSGTDALWLALRALDIGPGDSVLCPAYTFFATAATIVRVGARPVFADIRPGSFNLDPEDSIRRAEAAGNLSAVISVDLFGRVCDLGDLEPYCRERGIPIIQDAAQSIDARDASGAKVGAHADVACFSFYPTKNLGALGDAGGLVTKNSDLARRLSRLRVHGESEPGVYSEIGINSRLDAIQAVALSVKLRHLERWTSARRSLAALYDGLFAERGARSLADDSEAADSPLGDMRLPLRTPDKAPAPERHTYHQYVVRVPADRRAGLIRNLDQEGIASAIFYPRGLHQQPALAEFAPSEPLIETERACRETLALPLFPELGAEGVERVVEVVAEYLA
jgi:dTDP-4-amino-4,6-dideoxygalactose transaminase